MRIFLFLLCLGIFFLSPSTLNAQFVTQVSQMPGIKGNSGIKASNGRTHIVYDNLSSDGSQPNFIFYQSSTNGGFTYSAAVNVSPTDLFSIDPDVAVAPNGNIYVVWIGGSSSFSNILVSRSTNNGVSFSSPQVASVRAIAPVAPRINIDRNGVVYITYTEAINNNFTVFATTFNDSSFPLNLGRTAQISSPGVSSSDAPIVFDSQQNAYITYGDSTTGFNYVVTTGSPGVFNSPTIAFVGLSNFDTSPSLAVDTSGVVYLVTSFGLNGVLLKSTDGARSFGPAQFIPGSFGIGPSIAATGRNTITIAWTDLTGFNSRIASITSRNGGLSFEQKLFLSSDTVPSFRVYLTPNQNFVNACWSNQVTSDITNGTQIFSAILF